MAAVLLLVVGCTPSGGDGGPTTTSTTGAGSTTATVPEDGPAGGTSPADPVRLVVDATYRLRVVAPDRWGVSIGEGRVLVATDVDRWVVPPALPGATGIEFEVLDLADSPSPQDAMASVRDGRAGPAGCEAGGPVALPQGVVGARATYRCPDGPTVDLATLVVDASTLLLATSVVTSEDEAALVEEMLATVAVGPPRPPDGFRTDASGRIGVAFPATATWRLFAEVGTIAATPDIGGWIAGYGGSGSGLADTPGFLVTITPFEEPATADEMEGLIDQTLADLFVVPDGCTAPGREPFSTAILTGLAEPFSCTYGSEGSVAILFDPGAPLYAATIVSIVDPADPESAALVGRAVDSVVVTAP